MRRPLLLSLILLAAPSPAAQTPERRPLSLDDLFRMREVRDPQVSPDGGWVAYTVTTPNTQIDKHTSDLWMTSWDGRTTVRLTSSPGASEQAPRWSPDGRSLAFLSGRADPEGHDQLWLLSRRGGEAEQVTNVKTGIEDYVWAPDGEHLVFVIEDGDSVEVSSIADSGGAAAESDSTAARDSGATRAPRPIVIERYYFKEDYTGYVRRRRKHLYLFDLPTRQLAQLTHGPNDDLLPAWSPDSRYLVFTSKRVGEDPDRHANWDLFVIAATPGAVARQITQFTGPDNHPDWESRPAWSPDGRFIAYLQGGPDSLVYYAAPHLAVVPWGGGAPPRVLTAALDRWVDTPRWAPDGRSLYLRVEDDRTDYLARVPLAGGAPVQVLDGSQVVRAYSLGGDGRIAALLDAPDHPPEVYAVDGTALRPLSRQNDSLFARLRLARTEEITAKRRDGTAINGFLVHPVDAREPAPAILDIHGGPVSQFTNGFHFYWQLLAAQGYAVVAMNPRGSSGRGDKFALAIWADWGHKDAQDVLAGVDYAVKAGVADPNRLGVGGWSYGGILTNYVIAQDNRFRAAWSGASISNILAGYGTDQYVREYEAELGRPWENTATWLRLSFPFLHADRIHTPTLFLCGEKDFNVPLLNSEQMYQALRSLNVPTGLIIYPDQFHGISRPSYQRHRYAQYLAWFDRYVKAPL